MVDGYPTANAAGIGLAAQVLATDYNITGGASAAAGGTVTYGLTATGTCEVVYTAATSPGAALVAVDTTTGGGC